jgi:GSH-dependent disulfide-bond oxidoreductase
MIELYYWPTPNGHKLTMLLEELGTPFTIRRVNIGSGEQFDPDFLKISPNNRMPAMLDLAPVDGQQIAMFESGAMMLYLAEKHRRFIPDALAGRAQVLQWLFWQMAGFGPMLGQNHHFSSYAPEKIPYAITRYQNESRRLYGVLNKQLIGREFIADAYSIADMACYPWTLYAERQAIDLAEFPEVLRWQQSIQARPATIRAYAHGDFHKPGQPLTEEQRKVLFGQGAKS